MERKKRTPEQAWIAGEGHTWEGWFIEQDWGFNPNRPVRRVPLPRWDQLLLGGIAVGSACLSTFNIIHGDLPAAGEQVLITVIAEGARRFAAGRGKG